MKNNLPMEDVNPDLEILKSVGNTSEEGLKMLAKEDLALMPMEVYDGNIRLIERPEDVPQAISALRSSDIIGFDTETRPNFKKGQNHTVALLQLATRSTSYLFRINRIGLTDELVALIEDPEILKIGVSIHDDFHNLRKLREIEPAGFIELQKLVKQVRIGEASLAKIYGLLFGKRISKAQRLSNWEAEELTQAQQNYASLDAYACVEIYERIIKDIRAL